MTCSIVARDPGTGALGIAVQTCMFAARPSWAIIVRGFAASGWLTLPSSALAGLPE
jgi:uncharacterized Ntn-hydrolase superfamily protein